jgi:hypothetical protein
MAMPMNDLSGVLGRNMVSPLMAFTHALHERCLQAGFYARTADEAVQDRFAVSVNRQVERRLTV